MHKQHDNEEVAITPADMERFHRNAPMALKRRAGTYAFDELGNGLRSLFLGGVPLVGMLWFDWSARQLLMFLLIGTWVAILCDFAKLWFLEKQIQQWAAASYDNWHVWTIVAALRAGKTTAPKSHLRAKYEPWMGAFVDLLLGGIGTVLLLVMLSEAGEKLDGTLLADRGVRFSLISLIAYQVLFTVWEIFSHKREKSERQVKVAVGMRGIGLFLLLFLVVMTTDGQAKENSSSRIAMLLVNGGIVLLGIGTMIGPLFLCGETKWLKEYLAKRATAKK